MKKNGMLVWILLLCSMMLPFGAFAQENTEPMPLAYYQTETVNDDPARAYVEISPYENPVYLVPFADTQSDGWVCSFRFSEVNGVPFTMTAFHEIRYAADGQLIGWQTITDDFYFFETNRLEDGLWLEYGMRFDMPADVRWVAYQVDGVDDNGQPGSFHCLFELKDEVKPVQKPADFAMDQQPQEGLPFIVLSCDPAPVVAVMREDEAGSQLWWEYDIVIENTGDAAFTAVSYTEAGFNGEMSMFDMTYDAQDVITWCDQADCVLEPGERWVIECAMPVQEMTALGLRLTGTADDGSEMSFVGLSQLLHEMKSE